jgi:hypothetical protein
VIETYYQNSGCAESGTNQDGGEEGHNDDIELQKLVIYLSGKGNRTITTGGTIQCNLTITPWKGSV